MDHGFEQLGDRRFQQLVQALLVSEYPGLACLPVGMPDGGRDAIANVVDETSKTNGYFILQVKYAARPDYLTDPTAWVEDVIAKERKKIDDLVARGATQYTLATNLPVTSHLDRGSFDKVQAVLNGLPVRAQCLWREDLNRRLEAHWDLKWSYPELMTGTDLIRALVEGRLSEAADRRSRALRTFLADQHKTDRDVRFKQVDLHTDLVDVFIDVPAVVQRVHEGTMDLARRIHGLGSPSEGLQPDEFYSPHAYGAGSLLLDAWVQDHATHLVIEGAPGQGKSTMLQYVAQVHRMRLLEKRTDLERIPDSHRHAPVRVPFRVELRELAQWLSGVDPFSSEGQASPEAERTLEGFLAARVRASSGGAAFDVADLQAVVEVGPVMLALDGLDEVVDVGGRAAVVKELTDAVNRLAAVASSLQVVVTSRPASFVKSARFAEPFQYLTLTSLNRELIASYRDRWFAGRGLAASERHELSQTLDDKLTQPHFRDLCRNPMQLAIVLSLLHRKGPALPEQRTDLYTSYMEYFLDREATKSQAVRDHRKLLLLLHGYLACLLHIEAERSSRGAGRIRTDDLIGTAEAFVRSHGYKADLFSDLVGGVFDRFGALVSRVEGTFEFEIQPLREYFAGFYLYETAPYSPPGRSEAGTRPERLDAMMRHPFWLNVTRFYAGSYSVGELESLAGRLEALADDSQLRWTSLPRTVASQLLADWTFAQEPRAQERAVNVMVRGLGERHAGGSQDRGAFPYHERPLALPAKCGGDALVDALFSLAASTAGERVGVERLAYALAANAKPQQLADQWLNEIPSADSEVTPRWWSLGAYLDVFQHIEESQIRSILHRSRGQTRDYMLAAMANSGAYRLIDQSATDARRLIDRMFDADLTLNHRDTSHPLSALSALLQVDRDVLPEDRRYLYPVLERRWQVPTGKWPAVYNGCMELATAYDALRAEHRRWGQELRPWIELVEHARKLVGDRSALDRLAICASGVRDPSNRGRGHNELCDDSASLVLRARYARGRSNAPDWWRNELKSSPTPRHERLCLSLLLAWGERATLEELRRGIEALVDTLTPQDFEVLYNDLNCFARFGRGGRRRLTVAEVDTGSSRLFAALTPRYTQRGRRTLYTKRAYDTSKQADRPVRLEMLMQELELATTATSSWRGALQLLRQGTQHELLPPPYVCSEMARRMPRDIARMIVENAAEYPLYAAEVAELKMGLTARRSPSVEIVAKRQDWFRDVAKLDAKKAP